MSQFDQGRMIVVFQLRNGLELRHPIHQRLQATKFKGLEFRYASTYAYKVAIPSEVSLVSLTTTFSCFLKAFQCCLPQATEMQSMLWVEFPLYALTRTIVGECQIPCHLVNFTSSFDEVCAVVTPHSSKSAPSSDKSS